MRWLSVVVCLLASVVSGEDNQLHTALLTLGHMPDVDQAGVSITDTGVRSYAKFWGLTGQDWKDTVVRVKDHISRRHCMVPDIYALEEANWPPSCRDDLGMYVDWSRFSSSTTGLTQQKAATLFADALDSWNDEIKVKLYLSPNRDEARCYVGWSNLGGSVLAWSHLANNTCVRDKEQRYDLRRWGDHLFWITVLHEVGHLIGLSHRNGPYVMNPTIRTDLDGLTSRDIQDAVNLGYERGTLTPTPNPNPNPNPTPGGLTGVIILPDGTSVDARLVKRLQIVVEEDDGVIVIPLPSMVSRQKEVCGTCTAGVTSPYRKEDEYVFERTRSCCDGSVVIRTGQ